MCWHFTCWRMSSSAWCLSTCEASLKYLHHRYIHAHVIGALLWLMLYKAGNSYTIHITKREKGCWIA